MILESATLSVRPAHEIGFRQSKEYLQWKLLLHHFYDPFPVVSHYAPVESAAKQ